MEKELTCGECNMAFHSAGLLEKHETLFCIGREAGDLRVQTHGSDIVLRDKGGGIDPKQTRTPDLVQMRGQRRNIIRWSSVEGGPKSGRMEDKPNGAALQNLTDEVHRLRMSFEENMSNWSKKTTDIEVSERQLGHSERLKQMREMATLHERQLALIHAQHQQLEQQREELAHQVGVLSEQSNAARLESLLVELREQEERNEETLQELAEHLRALNVQQVSEPVDQAEPHKNKKMHHDSNEVISPVDGPLSTQIIALRHAYMQSGGSDPTIVAQMTDLQSEAQFLEENQAAAAAKARKKKLKPLRWSPNWKLLAVEQENQRLEEEILRIQLARERHCEAAVRTELDLLESENLQQILNLQAEMERSEGAVRPSKQHPPPPHPLPLQTKARIHASPSLLQMRSFSSPFGRHIMNRLDVLGPAPYDPAAGFVVFFDLVMGVDVSQTALRLVAALYSEGGEVGPPVQYLLGGPFPYPHNQGNSTLLSLKHPVSRIQPSPSLCLVVEVQAAGDQDVYHQEPFSQVSCGWAQLELFDRYNQLRSGWWRLPVRSLPIRPSLSLAQLNSIPQVGNMELCVRLVNGRDGDAQTLEKPDPTSTGNYRYAAVVSSLPVHGDEAPLAPSPQCTQAEQRSSLLPFTAHQEPPPTDEARQS